MNNTNPLKTYQYRSCFASIIEQFVNEKRSMGFRYESEAKKLAHFDRFLSAKQCQSRIERDIIEQYIAKKPEESCRNHNARYFLIKKVCYYMQLNGLDVYVPPSFTSVKGQSDFIPYILSSPQIAALIAAADNFPFNPKSEHRHIVLPMFLRLAYCCGLRASEALNLKQVDVDLNKGILHIKKSKFGNERYVPMSVDITDYAKAYTHRMAKILDKTHIFLPSSRLREYTTGYIYTLYRRTLIYAGISHFGKGNGPRLHDLRHTFAVHCLKKWVEQGVDVEAALPYLSAYMGHVSIYSTQRYLRLTHEVYPLITNAVEKLCGNIVPLIGGKA